MSELLKLFGHSYNQVGDTGTDFVIKTRGLVKVQWGRKFIDIVKDGKLNVNADFIKRVPTKDDIGNTDGLYVTNDGGVYLVSGGITIALAGEAGTMYVAYVGDQETTQEAKLQALKNIGIVFPTIQDAQMNITEGFVYIQEDKTFYTVENGVFTPYPSQEDSDVLTLDKRIITILNSGNQVINIQDGVINIDAPIISNEYIQSPTFISNIFKSEDGSTDKGFLVQTKGGISTLYVDYLVVRKQGGGGDKENNSSLVGNIQYSYKRNYIIDYNEETFTLAYPQQYKKNDVLRVYIYPEEPEQQNYQAIDFVVTQDSNGYEVFVNSADLEEDISLIGKEVFLVQEAGSVTRRSDEQNIDLIDLEKKDESVIHTRIGDITDYKTYTEKEHTQGLFSDQPVFAGGEFREPINEDSGISSKTYNFTALKNNYTVKAVFTENSSLQSVQTYSFDENMGGLQIMKNGAIIDIENNSETNYPISTILVLQAVPKSGYFFDHWEINGQISEDTATAKRLLILLDNYTITPVFTEQPSTNEPICFLVYNTNPTNGGVIKRNGTRKINGEIEKCQIDETPTFNAVANEGYHFTKWVITDRFGSREDTNPDTSYLIGSNTTIQAYFEHDSQDETTFVTYEIAGIGNIQANGINQSSGNEVMYAIGAVINLNAVESMSGYTFDHWEIDNVNDLGVQNFPRYSQALNDTLCIYHKTVEDEDVFNDVIPTIRWVKQNASALNTPLNEINLAELGEPPAPELDEEGNEIPIAIIHDSAGWKYMQVVPWTVFKKCCDEMRAATKKYTVSWYTKEGELYTTTQVQNNTIAVFPPVNPTRKHWKFLQWGYDGTPITADTNIYAEWEYIPPIIHISANPAQISNLGGNTTVSYYVEWDGEIITKGITVEGSASNISYSEDGPAYILNNRVNRNLVIQESTYSVLGKIYFLAKFMGEEGDQEGMGEVTASTVLQQRPAGALVLPEFDLMKFSTEWTNTTTEDMTGIEDWTQQEDGTWIYKDAGDLDIYTHTEGSNIPITEEKTLDNYGVGYAGNKDMSQIQIAANIPITVRKNKTEILDTNGVEVTKETIEQYNLDNNIVDSSGNLMPDKGKDVYDLYQYLAWSGDNIKSLSLNTEGEYTVLNFSKLVDNSVRQGQKAIFIYIQNIWAMTYNGTGQFNITYDIYKLNDEEKGLTSPARSYNFVEEDTSVEKIVVENNKLLGLYKAKRRPDEPFGRLESYGDPTATLYYDLATQEITFIQGYYTEEDIYGKSGSEDTFIWVDEELEP